MFQHAASSDAGRPHAHEGYMARNGSQSMADLRSVLHPEKAEKAGNGVLEPMLDRATVPTQVHENDVARVVITCEPEGASLMMGALHPCASLYEQPVNLQAAKSTHEEFRNLLRRNKCKVLTLRDILKHDVDTSVTERMRLERFAMRCLTYAAHEDHQELGAENMYHVSDAYKMEVLKNMSTEHLIDTIMIHPTVTLARSGRDTGLTATYSFQPLSNLVYLRDQQITTRRGIVLGSLRSQQRQLEVDLMQFAFEKLGMRTVGRLQPPAYLEGGDFFPAGPDLAILGVGLRSSYEAAHALMDQDLLGTRRLAVVRDDFDRDQARMHLDCVFSILTDTCCLMWEGMMGADKERRRLADIYVRDKERPGATYRLERSDVEFSEFMKGEGYSIMPVSDANQLRYGCNCLNLGAGSIISVDEETARQIVSFPDFQGHVQYIDFSSMTCMYGAVHCASQVVLREPLQKQVD